MIDFKQEAQDISKELVEFRRNFHMHPKQAGQNFTLLKQSLPCWNLLESK